MRHQIPTSLRQPEERYAARALADGILRADRQRQRRMTVNDQLGADQEAGSGAFGALVHHPLYRARRT